MTQNNDTHIGSSDLTKLALHFKSWFITQPEFKDAENQEDITESINDLISSITHKTPALVWEAAIDLLHEMPWEVDEAPEEWDNLYFAVDEFREQHDVTSTNVHDTKSAPRKQSTFSILITNSEQDIAAELNVLLQDANGEGEHPTVVFNIDQCLSPIMIGLNQQFTNAHKVLQSIKDEINGAEINTGELHISKQSQVHLEGVKVKAEDHTWAIVQNKPDTDLNTVEQRFNDVYDAPSREDYLYQLEYPTSGMKP